MSIYKCNIKAISSNISEQISVIILNAVIILSFIIIAFNENIIGALQIQKEFWYPIKMFIFQYCETSIGFSLLLYI